MKYSFKNTLYLLAGGAFSVFLYSCNGNSSTSSTTSSDTTKTAALVATPADTTANAANANNTAPSDANSQFVNDVTGANAKEIMMLQAGVDKGTNKDLKADAKKMLADHKKLAKQMSEWASKKNMNVPAPDTTMNDMGDMSSKTGKDFDKAWTDAMVDGHKKTIARFEKGQNEVTDEDLKGLITNTLPTLHSHLDMVTKLQDKMNK